MSTPALDHWFSFEGRRNRKSFMLSIAALYATFVVAFLIWQLFAETDRGRDIGEFVFGVPTIICSYLLVAQRLRDFGVSGWFALLWGVVHGFETEVRIALLVATLLVLCGIPGTTGPNKFGDDPLT